MWQRQLSRYNVRKAVQRGDGGTPGIGFCLVICPVVLRVSLCQLRLAGVAHFLVMKCATMMVRGMLVVAQVVLPPHV